MKKLSFGSIGGILIIVACVLMIYMLVFTSRFDFWMPKTVRIVFAVVFGLYGIARGYQFFKNKK
ncbi:MAG: hypothetical protein FWD66_07685 [Paludibacter sp.]|nr:hypothetical protein [Paludibacter sp.]